MKLISQSIVAVVIALFCVNSFAVEKKKLRYPLGCKPVGYSFQYFNVMFKPTAKYHPQTLYFVKNISNRDINMMQARKGDEDYVVYMRNTIKPNRWSALALDEKNAKFICTNKNKKQKTHAVVNCRKVLDICEFTQVRFGTNHRGNYWVTHNKSMRGAYNATKWHGVLLVDPKRK